MKPAALLAGAAAAAAAITLAALAWWPQPVLQTSAAAPQSLPMAALAALARAPQQDDAPPAPAFAADAADTRLPASWLGGGLRERLEAWLMDAGEAVSPEALKRQLAARVGQHFPPAEAARAQALAERYVDYRVALGALRAPADPGDPYALRQALDARQRVRQLHFGAEEYQALFGAEDVADRAMLARTDILRNPQLGERQRAEALAAVEQQLPPAERALRSAAAAHLDVGAQTAAFDAQGTDPVTRQQLRAAQYGQEASERLAALDAQQAQWQARLSDYAAAQARQASAAELAQLRATLFSPEESLRVDAALRLRQLNAPQPGAH